MRHWLTACLALGLAAETASAQPDWYTSEKNQAKASAEQPVGPCAAPAWAPIATSVRDSGLDAALDPCLTTRLSSWTRALILVDTPEFYGTVAAAMFAELRWRYLRDFEVTIGTRILDYRFAQNAVVTADELSAGPLYLAAASSSDRRLAGQPLVWAWKLRFEVPWTDTSSDVAVVAASPQLAALWALGSRWRLHGRVAALLWAARPPGDVLVRQAGLASSELAFVPVPSISLAAGVETQVGWYGLGLDHLLGKAAVRFALGNRWQTELGFAVPALGDERTDAVVLLGLARQM